MFFPPQELLGPVGLLKCKWVLDSLEAFVCLPLTCYSSLLPSALLVIVYGLGCAVLWGLGVLGFGWGLEMEVGVSGGLGSPVGLGGSLEEVCFS